MATKGASAPVDRSTTLLTRVTCPHCWNRFSPHEALWVAQHPDLVHDERLGPDHQKRFLPSRFTPDGAAIDARGFACSDLACPKCHLGVPRALFQLQPFLVSILGAPASGKSYFLASMIWMLRQTFPKYFALSFGDADPRMNHQLNEYEELQFLNPDQDKLVSIQKTEEQGDLYDLVTMGGQDIRFPRPFVFSLRPSDRHPSRDVTAEKSRALCLYDNAGESFLPGADRGSNQVTRHLGLSRALMFLFDPTQDLRFRRACQGKTDDLQMAARTERTEREKAVRQDVILQEATERIRRQNGLGYGMKHQRPLIVAVTKYDCWSSLLDGEPLPKPWVSGRGVDLHGLDIGIVERMSKRVRKILWELTPEIVSTAEAFAETVLFVPVSSIGRSPELDPVTGKLAVRPRDMQPQWAEVPLLTVLALGTSGLVPWTRSSK